MENNFLTSYQKDFETEAKQIQYWFNTLCEIKNQTGALKDSSESEVKLMDTLGRAIQAGVKTYNTETLGYSDEPSQLWILTTNFTAMLETISKVFCEDITVLNEHINKYSTVITTDVNNLVKNITETSGSHMREVIELKKKATALQNRYTKLKDTFESAHMSKKKLEIDPNNLYNVTLKEKAEQKILSYLKEMKELMPLIEANGKELEEKKVLLNKNMKESFELVIGCIFKNNIKIRQALFVVSKEKTSYLKKLRLYLTERNRKFREINFSLNDYIERKYAESKNIFYDSLDSISIRNDDYGLSMLQACDNILKYSNNFYNCMRTRKRTLRVFSKLILDYSKGEDSFSQAFGKVNKQLQTMIQNFSFIGTGSHKSWDIYKTMFDINNKLHDNFGKFLVNNIFNTINIYIKEYKQEYNSFVSNWNKYVKDINNVKSNIAKHNLNREKIQIQIKQIRSTLSSQDLAKSETKLTQLKDNENSIKETLVDYVKKTKTNVELAVDYLKKTIKTMREKEYKRVLLFIENLETITMTYDKILDQNIDLANTQMEITANVDIYADIKEIYERYFNTYKINEAFLDKVIKKALKNFTVNSENEIFNISYNSPTQKRSPPMVLKQFNSGNSAGPFEGIRPIEGDFSAIPGFGGSVNFRVESSSDEDEGQLISKELDVGRFSFKPAEENKQSSNNRYHDNSNSSDLINENITEDDKLNFVNTQNFKVIDKRKLSFNIRENDLKDYYDKLDNFGKEQVVKDDAQMHEDIFPIDPDEKVLENYNCAYTNRILLQGKLYITSKKIVFYSWFNNQTLFGTTKLIIPKEDIVKIEKKTHLKFFDNSIQITTKKSKLFFTSFVSRDTCYNILMDVFEPGKAFPPADNDLKDDECQDCDINDDQGNNNNEGPKTTISKGVYFTRLLKKINFYNRLEEIHQKRYKLFEGSGQYRTENTFPKVYYNNEHFANVPLTLIYKNFFDRETTCDELKKDKTFWESLFELRNDANIVFEQPSLNVPKFFDDIEYTSSVFVNLEEEAISEFLNDIDNWPTQPTVFNYKFIHPIKKKFVGPDRLKLKDEYSIFFVSPKLLIIENINYGSDFPYADCFFSIVQYRFTTDYKYSSAENIFKFTTSMSVMFQIVFVKSCLFRSIIESEGYKESEENLRFNTCEKMKMVIEQQSEFFGQQFTMMNEEHLRKTNVKVFSSMLKEEGEGGDALPDDVCDEEVLNEEVRFTKFGFTIQGKGSRFTLPGLGVMAAVYLVTVVILMIALGKIEFNLGLDKMINCITLLFLGVLVYKLNFMKTLTTTS
jgi:hypothetical protein